jgi:DNA-binding NarL/FixJ family response regulator
MYTILFADDQAVMRDAVSGVLLHELDVAAVSLAVDGAEAISLCGHNHFDAVVLDIAMPVCNGIQALQAINQAQPSLPVVMLSTSIDTQTVQRCLTLGALGFVAKQSAYDELIKAVRAVLAGETYLCRIVQESLRTHDA